MGCAETAGGCCCTARCGRSRGGVLLAGGDDLARVGQGDDPVGGEPRGAERRGDALQVAVLRGVARLHEGERAAWGRGPYIAGETDNRWPVLHRALVGHTLQLHELVEHADDSWPRQ
jgi:hypothetical protein